MHISEKNFSDLSRSVHISTSGSFQWIFLWLLRAWCVWLDVTLPPPDNTAIFGFSILGPFLSPQRASERNFVWNRGSFVLVVFRENTQLSLLHYASSFQRAINNIIKLHSPFVLPALSKGRRYINKVLYCSFQKPNFHNDNTKFSHHIWIKEALLWRGKRRNDIIGAVYSLSIILSGKCRGSTFSHKDRPVCKWSPLSHTQTARQVLPPPHDSSL